MIASYVFYHFTWYNLRVRNHTWWHQQRKHTLTAIWLTALSDALSNNVLFLSDFLINFNDCPQPGEATLLLYFESLGVVPLAFRQWWPIRRGLVGPTSRQTSLSALSTWWRHSGAGEAFRGSRNCPVIAVPRKPTPSQLSPSSSPLSRRWWGHESKIATADCVVSNR